MLHVGLAELHLAMRQPDRAIDALARTLERYPRFWYARLVRGHALEQRGRHHEALQEYLEAERATPHNFAVTASVVSAFAATGDAREARRRVEDAERRSRSTFVPAFDLGLMRIALGDVDLGFDWLQRSCDQKETRLAGIGSHPGVDRIRQDPRFGELLACVGLPKPFGATDAQTTRR
jgi:tetratricopeptide (TPR) repeat protein